MLEPPAVSDAEILGCLRAEYGLKEVSLVFLPLGADLRTAVYRATDVDGRTYFVKLRIGPFDELAALLPRWLAEQGIFEVMAPLPARSGRPWAASTGFSLLLYPFIAGRDAYRAILSERQWLAFGRAVRAVHDASLPPALAELVLHETYDPRWRDELRDYVAQIYSRSYVDSVALQLSTILGDRREQVLDLIARTERLARALRDGAHRHVLCHTDIHAGNLLVADDGRLFIVDWDAPMFARRERDLMYPGGGQGFLGRSAGEEEALFYAGYGAIAVDTKALAYYRLERIIEDLAIFCAQLLGDGRERGTDDEADRVQALRWAVSNFRPGGVLEIAYRTAQRAEASER